MKILICTGIYPPDIGGPATYSKLLFDELPKRGIGVEILSFGKVRKYPKIFRHFLYFLKILKRGRDVDLIYAQDPVSVGFPSCLASKILGKKFVLKVVGDYAWEQQQQKKNAGFVTPEDFQNIQVDLISGVRRKIERRVAKRAGRVVVPSEYLKKIVMMWGVDEDKIKVVYNAFSPKEILETKEDLRRQFGFADSDFDLKNGDKTIIFSVGRLVPWKGFEMLIDIIKDLSDFKLLIAGDGPDKKRLEKKINDFGLGDRIKLLGRLEQNDLLKKIKASDLFVLNTGYEGLSHQLLEVMSVGTPIITTSSGGNPEIIGNDTEGLLVEYNDKKGLRDSLLKLSKDKVVAERLANNAKERVKMFNKEKMLNEIVTFLQGKNLE